MKNILIIGFGKTGSHLYCALKNSGKAYSVNLIKNSHAKTGAARIAEAEIIFLCTQDDKLDKAVNTISDLCVSLRGKIITHTSGALSSKELVQLKESGARTASFHPVQTFKNKAKRQTGLFRGIYIAIEGDKKAVKELSAAAKSIGSIPFEIETGFKTLHHICCVISSNYLVTHLSNLRDIYRKKNGFKKVNFLSIYMPLVQQTISNILSSGTENSLTGPIERKDYKTLKKHIAELETFKSKEIVDYYRFIGERTVKIALQKGSLNKKESEELKKLFKKKN